MLQCPSLLEPVHLSYVSGGLFRVFKLEGISSLIYPFTDVNYRLAFRTKNTFPAGLQDAISSYAYLVQDIGVPPPNICIMGDSAGGGLSAALSIYLHENKLPNAGKLCLLSVSCYNKNTSFHRLSLTFCLSHGWTLP